MRVAVIRRFKRGASAEERAEFGRSLLAKADALGIGPGDPVALVHPHDLADDCPTPGKCKFCGKDVNVNLDLQFGDGWIRPRSDGGTNALALRRVHPDKWACRDCIDRQKRGVSPQQQSLETSNAPAEAGAS